jgi:hypothetical protein
MSRPAPANSWIDLPLDDVTNGTVLVSAVTGKKIRIVQAFFNCDAVGTVQFRSGNTPTNITGTIGVGTSAGTVQWQYNPEGWCETATGEKLSVSIATATKIRGILKYTLVDP